MTTGHMTLGGRGGVRGVREKALVVHDAQVAGHYLVLQHGAGRDIDAISVVGDDDDGALRRETERAELSSVRGQRGRRGDTSPLGGVIKALVTGST